MRIMIVDDNSTSLMVLTKLASKIGQCETIAFSDPFDALVKMPDLDFDVAIVDFNMPVYNGVEFVSEVMRFDKYKDKVVIIVTADTDLATRMAALNAGAIDFLTKPINPLEFRARLKNLAALVDAREKMFKKTARLKQQVEKAFREIRRREEEIIHRLSVAASYKDPEVASHTLRVGAYSEAIAQAYGLSDALCADLKLASQVHDVGKLAIADAVLLKKRKRTEGEFAEMQRHTIAGCGILQDTGSGLLSLAAEIAGGHHERWDGQGYPLRKSGEDIPLSARIVAVADNFDTMTTPRPYKDAWPVQVAAGRIQQRAGTQFDPRCLVAFAAAMPRILEIKRSEVGEIPYHATSRNNLLSQLLPAY